MAFEDSNTPDGASGSSANGTTPNGSSANGTIGGGTGNGAPERRGITVRRAPRFVPFMVLGGLLGIAVAAFVAYGLPGDPSFDANSVFGFFLVAFAAAGVILGSIVALLLDRLSVRRAERAVVESVPDSSEDQPGA
jgi:hypothetical protein